MSKTNSTKPTVIENTENEPFLLSVNLSPYGVYEPEELEARITNEYIEIIGNQKWKMATGGADKRNFVRRHVLPNYIDLNAIFCRLIDEDKSTLLISAPSISFVSKLTNSNQPKVDYTLAFNSKGIQYLKCYNIKNSNSSLRGLLVKEKSNTSMNNDEAATMWFDLVRKKPNTSGTGGNSSRTRLFSNEQGQKNINFVNSLRNKEQAKFKKIRLNVDQLMNDEKKQQIDSKKEAATSTTPKKKKSKRNKSKKKKEETSSATAIELENKEEEEEKNKQQQPKQQQKQQKNKDEKDKEIESGKKENNTKRSSKDKSIKPRNKEKSISKEKSVTKEDEISTSNKENKSDKPRSSSSSVEKKEELLLINLESNDESNLNKSLSLKEKNTNKGIRGLLSNLLGGSFASNQDSGSSTQSSEESLTIIEKIDLEDGNNKKKEKHVVIVE